MSSYLSFFTPFEKYVMQKYIVPREGGGGGHSVGTRYTFVCYVLLIVIVVTIFTNIVAYGMQNTDMINSDKGMNSGLTITQFTLGLTIMLFSIVVAAMHYSHNKESYITGLNVKYDLDDFMKRSQGKVEGVTGFSLGIKPAVFIFMLLTFSYGLMMAFFSGDRLVCTTSGTCSFTKLSEDDKKSLGVP